MIQVSMVPRQYIGTCWDKVGPFLDGAADYTYGRYTLDNIRTAITDYEHDLWVAFEDSEIKGAVVTNILIYPQKKVLSMTFCGGVNLSEWKDPMLDILRRYAKDRGCDAIEATARRGWAKIFQNDGHKSLWATFELPLEGVNHG